MNLETNKMNSKKSAKFLIMKEKKFQKISETGNNLILIGRFCLFFLLFFTQKSDYTLLNGYDF
jgi:hypothetical protein